MKRAGRAVVDVVLAVLVGAGLSIAVIAVGSQLGWLPARLPTDERIWVSGTVVAAAAVAPMFSATV